MDAIVLSVRLFEPRYHGTGAWPPEPGRLFQALLAGVGLRGPRTVTRFGSTLRELEALGAPELWAPPAYRGQRYTNYVPNNNGDKVKGDIRKLAQHRTAKNIQPYLVLGEPTVYFLWRPPAWSHLDSAPEALAERIDDLASQLYQLGRGVDFACAWADYLENERQFVTSLHAQGLRRYRPSPSTTLTHPGSAATIRLRVPRTGTLDTLLERHDAFGQRHRFDASMNRVLYRQPAPAHFDMVTYEQAPFRRLYVLESPDRPGRMVTWPLERVVTLIEKVREGVIARLLRAADPGQIPSVAMRQALRGARPGEPRLVDALDRVRFVPMPSFGHVHADREIRRLLVEVPTRCPLPADDVFWAIGALQVDERDKEPLAVLRPADETTDKHLRHYGVHGHASPHWRSVTPLVLPSHFGARDGSATTRRRRERYLAKALRAALRHAGWTGLGVPQVQFQREPFATHEERAESFARGTRFDPDRLLHVRLTLDTAVHGPLVLGDGRFVGLGLMAPEESYAGAWRVRCAPWPDQADPRQLARAVRRAVMARFQAQQPGESLPTWVSGHEPDGRPADRARSGHLYFVADKTDRALVILAPHCVEGRSPTEHETRHLATLESALAGFRSLRFAGGRSLTVTIEADPSLPWLRGKARRWRSASAYLVTRHRKLGSAADALIADVLQECARHGLPRPRVGVERYDSRAGEGLSGWLSLTFASAQRGPLLLGHSRHLGGGLFVPDSG